MTPDDFRRIALSQAGACEMSHMGHPDFRVNGKIFATLAYPNVGWGMVKLAPEDQATFIERDPAAFQPVPGAWGKGGATRVHLAVADEDAVGEALSIAARSVTTKKPRKKPA